MVFHLVKKDFLLAKKYWIVMLVAAFVLPIFIHTRVDFITGGFLGFFISTLFIQYLLFNTVSMIEYKCKGAALLCATPYTRRAMVRAKYVFILAIFAGCYMLYSLSALAIPALAESLSASEVGLAVLILAVFFGTMIPVQYRYGYEKSKHIFMFILFLFPFVFPVMLKSMMQANRFELHDVIPLPQTVQGLFFGVLALLILGISMELSVRIYAKQSL
ncbi:ABC-2 transporter permease [Brevibacillus borstelensis]|uniref:ABC-2 transporter permease n=1 Tax=Brevibacillus borstelensis TaxID=45462 RepID=UPI0030BA92BB